MARKVFVLSMPRSGSTLLTHALGAHARIHMTCHGGWLPWLRRVSAQGRSPRGTRVEEWDGSSTPGIMDAEVARRLERLLPAKIREIVDDLFAELGAAEARFVGDKIMSPADLEFALDTWPDARFFWVVRDFRDSLVSSFDTERHGMELGFSGLSWQERARWIETWMERTEALLEGRSARYEVVRFEKLVANLEGNLRHLLASLGLRCDASSSAFVQEGATSLFTRHATVRKPTEGIGRWRRDIPSEHTGQVNAALAPLLEKWAYA